MKMIEKDDSTSHSSQAKHVGRIGFKSNWIRKGMECSNSLLPGNHLVAHVGHCGERSGDVVARNTGILIDE